jgi:hypothetical protein
MVTAEDLVPVQLGPDEGLRVLRVGYFVGVPAVLGEFRDAAVGGGTGQLRLRMGSKELKR